MTQISLYNSPNFRKAKTTKKENKDCIDNRILIVPFSKPKVQTPLAHVEEVEEIEIKPSEHIVPEKVVKSKSEKQLKKENRYKKNLERKVEQGIFLKEKEAKKMLLNKTIPDQSGKSLTPGAEAIQRHRERQDIRLAAQRGSYPAITTKQKPTVSVKTAIANSLRKTKTETKSIVEEKVPFVIRCKEEYEKHKEERRKRILAGNKPKHFKVRKKTKKITVKRYKIA